MTHEQEAKEHHIELGKKYYKRGVTEEMVLDYDDYTSKIPWHNVGYYGKYIREGITITRAKEKELKATQLTYIPINETIIIIHPHYY